ncbi:MAG: NAD(+) synthase [Lachnospiraceae bacterium]|nr:NAD(+) synthase [Lachnospiraceae bacterium]
MKDGWIRSAACTVGVTVADPIANGEAIREMMRQTSEHGCRVVVFPELSITAYTCGDLFFQEPLLRSAEEELSLIVQESEDLPGIFFVGFPFSWKGKLYNTAAAVSGGQILGLVPKRFLPNYHEFYERRQFTPGPEEVTTVRMLGKEVPFGSKLLFHCEEMPTLTIAAEICEDLWVPDPPSTSHCLHGATVIVNLSASNELTGKSDYRRSLIENQSARLYCGYVYAAAGPGESTGDLVFSGDSMIADAGRLKAENTLYREGCISSEIDLYALQSYRQEMTTFSVSPDDDGYVTVPFHLPVEETALSGKVDPAPFVPSDAGKRAQRCQEILAIQAMGLRKRLAHTHAKSAVIGISGGLDSTLALLVTVRAFDLLGLPRKGIKAVTMPGFGTTDRTYTNAVDLIRILGADFIEVPIGPSVLQHFKDIGQDPEKHDVTYENGQARERTQILMDIANKENGLVIGTGDLSELALGWATYNGDHMSMYGVNASVPKTLVRFLVRHVAEESEKDLKKVLFDVLDTPVSPELLPPKDGKIAQKTEDIVGPYELHDFFLYYVMRFGFSPRKILRLAENAFEGTYDRETILKWMRNFYWRFFAQQFKRSCLPDGPKVGSVALSPRGDWRMPSDAISRIWIEEVKAL